MSDYNRQLNIKDNAEQRKMFQKAGRDVELEKMISQKKYKTLLMALVATSAVYTPLLIVAFVLTGFYVSLMEIYFHGFGSVHWFAFVGGLCIGGFPIIFCTKTYIHPDTEIKSYKIKDEGVMDLVVSDGERVVRGARITQGAPSAVLEQALKDAEKLAEYTKSYLKDRDLNRLALVDRLYPKYVPPTLLAETPFPYSMENRALFFIGSAGSGKSQGIKELIFNVWNRKCRDKFVIYDRKPEYLTMMFRTGDKIICPADLRHTSWDLFAEIEGEQDLDGAIASLIPPATGEKANEKFWVDSARNVFRAILVYLMEAQRERCDWWDRQYRNYENGGDFVCYELHEANKLKALIYQFENVLDIGDDPESNEDYRNYFTTIVLNKENKNDWNSSLASIGVVYNQLLDTMKAQDKELREKYPDNPNHPEILDNLKRIEAFTKPEGVGYERKPYMENRIEQYIMAELKDNKKIPGGFSLKDPFERIVVNLRFVYNKKNDAARNPSRKPPVRPYEKPSNEDLVKFMSVTVSDPNYLWMCMKKNSTTEFLASGLSAAEKPNSPSTTVNSILSTLTSYTASFTRPEVAERGEFSIRKWLNATDTEGEAIFLANPAKYQDNYTSYFTVIVNLALSEMISIPNDNNRRVWFLLDEFGSLQQLGSIVRLLAEGRSKGACTVLGTQDLAQLKKKYGDEHKTIVNNCNSCCIARVTDQEEATYFSKNIGDVEIEKEESDQQMQISKEISFTMTDKNNNTRREKRDLVLPSEITNMKDLTYVSKFVDKGWGIRRIEYYNWGNHERVPEFVERPREAFDTQRIFLDNDTFLISKMRRDVQNNDPKNKGGSGSRRY